MSILSEILATKHTEVAWSKEHTPPHLMQEQLMNAPPVRDFRAALSAVSGKNSLNSGAIDGSESYQAAYRVERQQRIGLIAEVKKASPSKGVIREDFDPIAIAKEYAASGATCLSVLTDEKFFQGKLAYLRQIREVVSLPLLRKDFIVDAWQIPESRAAGADAILLIVAALCPADLRNLLAVTEQHGMTALVEVHDADEMAEALSAGASVIGINNRNLHTFRTSISVTLDLLHGIPDRDGKLFISESGISSCGDVKLLQEAGVDAVLIGESLMREADIGAKVCDLMGWKPALGS